MICAAVARWGWRRRGCAGRRTAATSSTSAGSDDGAEEDDDRAPVRAGELPRPAQRAALQLLALHRLGVARHHHVRSHTHGCEDTDGIAHFVRWPPCVASALAARGLRPVARRGVRRRHRRRASTKVAAPAAPSTASRCDTADTVRPPTTDPAATEPNGTEPTGTDTHRHRARRRRSVRLERDRRRHRGGLPGGAARLRRPHRRHHRRSTSCATGRSTRPHRIGTLLVNPGGPGYGGSGLAYSADGIYGQDLLDRFDIVGWDPRGTGFSEPAIDCIDDYDHLLRARLVARHARGTAGSSIDVGTEFGAGVPAQEQQTCCRSSAPRARPATWTPSARRWARTTISYFGFSYGSELGATWATLFPDTVRAAVLDGAVDPTVGYLQQNIQQAAGFEATFATFLAAVQRRAACAFHNDGDAEGAFDAARRRDRRRARSRVDAGPHRRHPGRADHRRRRRRCTTSRTGRSWSRRSPTCRTATGRASSTSTTTTSATTAASGTTRSRRTSPSAASTTRAAPAPTTCSPTRPSSPPRRRGSVAAGWPS